jgi:uncharacterized protein (TIGR03086 family)
MEDQGNRSLCYGADMQAIVDQVTRLAHAFDARVQATPADAWGNQSPCEDWTARDVVVHMSNNFNRLAGHHDPVGADDDIVESWNLAKARLEERMTGDLSVEMPGPAGPMTLAQMLGRFVSMDTLVHTFDLARATGGDEALDPQAVSMSFSGLKAMGEGIRRPGFFGPATPCPDDASEQTQFLCHLGRPI